MPISFDQDVNHVAGCHDGGIRPNMTYVGLSMLLPEELHALCSCAGLFYVQVLDVCVGGDLYRVEIAALPRYFSADQRSSQRHVRTIFLTEGQCAQLVEWDRRLAAMATCDVRDLVEAHTRQIQATHRLPPADEVPTRETVAAPVHLHEATQSPTVVHHGDVREIVEQHTALHTAQIHCQEQTIQQTAEDVPPGAEQQEEMSQLPTPRAYHVRTAPLAREARYTEVTTVVVPVEAIKAAYEQVEQRQHHPLSRRQLPLLVLRAALGVVQHTQSEAQLRRALVMRDKEPVHLELHPVYARGRQCGRVRISMRVDVLQPAA